jgi:hypothetical protein
MLYYGLPIRIGSAAPLPDVYSLSNIYALPDIYAAPIGQQPVPD